MNPYKVKARRLDAVLKASRRAGARGMDPRHNANRERFKEEVRKAHAAGVPVTVLADALGVSRARVYEMMEG